MEAYQETSSTGSTSYAFHSFSSFPGGIIHVCIRSKIINGDAKVIAKGYVTKKA